ncbi:MAG: carboxypeptidase-like regulatory domain-containing protein [Planctomycetaceae bacterium]|nr:carboxypeptidase-like regulatory domain-containing protein [Planctomycetaceae bacterium]
MKKTCIVISIFFVLNLILFFGCGHSASGRVTGVVLLDGKPLGNAAITFYPAEAGSPAVGMTDASGRYELAVSHSVKGAVPGKYKVTISTEQSERPDYSTKETKIIPAIPESVPKKLTDQNTTDLIKEIKSGTQKIDFAITSEPKTNETKIDENK